MSRAGIGYLLRAAALTELLLTGHLADESGRARVVRERVRDPVLDAVLRQVAGSRPRSWEHWVRKDDQAIMRAVRDQLEAGRWVRVDPRRVLGVFPSTRITVRRPFPVKRLAGRVAGALRPGRPAARAEARDAAVLALAAAGELRTVLDPARRRERGRRIAELTERTGPAAPALRKALRHDRAAAS